MKNITISIDEETYRHARIWADKRGTSISAIVKCILVSLPLRTPAPARQSGKYSLQAVAADPAIRTAAASCPDSPVSKRARPSRKKVTLIPAHGLSILGATLQFARQPLARKRKKTVDLSASTCEPFTGQSTTRAHSAACRNPLLCLHPVSQVMKREKPAISRQN